MELPDACAALNASAENGTAVLLAHAGTSGAAVAKIPANAPAINAPFKNLRVKIIVSSVVCIWLPNSASDGGRMP